MTTTTDSSTRCSRKPERPWRSVVLACIALAALLATLPAAAQGIGIRNATVAASDDGYQLDADFDIQLSPRLEEAVNRGVALYFVVDFELTRPRWYWFDDKPVQVSKTYKITYTPLLRQYRLAVGNVYQNFTRLDEVMRVMARVRGWPAADKGTLGKEGPYLAQIRMRLDTSQLPKPFQLDAVGSRDWNLSSDWYRWNVTP
jgi:Domain of unknown function (DUF4390)